MTASHSALDIYDGAIEGFPTVLIVKKAVRKHIRSISKLREQYREEFEEEWLTRIVWIHSMMS